MQFLSQNCACSHPTACDIDRAPCWHALLSLEMRIVRSNACFCIRSQ